MKRKKRKCKAVPQMPYPCDGPFTCRGGKCPSRDKYERKKVKYDVE
jgi:hypothetical protein